jgi:hypothetical protein
MLVSFDNYNSNDTNDNNTTTHASSHLCDARERDCEDNNKKTFTRRES